MKKITNHSNKHSIHTKKRGRAPKFFQKKVFVLIFVSIFFLELVSFLGGFDTNYISRFLAAVYPQAVVDLTNDYRQQNELGILSVNKLLLEAAQLKAEDMAGKSYFAHTSPEGITPWYWLDKVGYNFVYAGENLAVNFSDSKSVVQAWINSLSHRANILSQNFSEIGIATADGIYKGKEATFVVQYFGNRRKGELASLIKKVNDGKINEQDNIKISSNSKIESKIVLGEEIIREEQQNAITDFEQKEGSLVVLNRLEGTSLPQRASFYSSFFSQIFSTPRNVIIFSILSILIIILISMSIKMMSNIRVRFIALTLNSIFALLVIYAAFLFNHCLILLLSKIA